MLHPDDTVSAFSLELSDHITSEPLLHSYTLGGFGFTDSRLEFLLQGVVSDRPWIGDTMLMTLALSNRGIFSTGGKDVSFVDGVHAFLLSELIDGTELGDNAFGYNTEVAFANVLSAPVPASLPLLLSGLALLGLTKRFMYRYDRLHRSL